MRARLVRTIDIVHPRALAQRLGQPNYSVAVVIDVLRCSTTLAACQVAGVRSIHLAADRHALAGWDDPVDRMLIGEDGGRREVGFAIGNSPSSVLASDVAGADVVVLSSNGAPVTMIAAEYASEVLCGSFANAPAIIERIRALTDGSVALIPSSAWTAPDYEEDVACCEFISDVLAERESDPDAYLAQVESSPAAEKFLTGHPDFPHDDLRVSATLGWCHDVLSVVRVQDGIARVGCP